MAVRDTAITWAAGPGTIADLVEDTAIGVDIVAVLVGTGLGVAVLDSTSLVVVIPGDIDLAVAVPGDIDLVVAVPEDIGLEDFVLTFT